MQANLSYLAALADRKGTVQTPQHPAYMTPPPLNLTVKVRAQPPGADASDGNTDPMVDREERFKYLGELYGKLQALFPGVDLKGPQPSNAQQRHQQQQGSKSNVVSTQASPVVAPPQGLPQAQPAVPS